MFSDRLKAKKVQKNRAVNITDSVDCSWWRIIPSQDLRRGSEPRLLLESHSYSWVHLLLVIGSREGGLDLSVISLQAVHEGWYRGHGHCLMLHSIAHIGGMQVLPLVRHDLGGLLAIQYREIGGHVDIHIVHGSFGQTTVGLGPCWGCSGP